MTRNRAAETGGLTPSGVSPAGLGESTTRYVDPSFSGFTAGLSKILLAETVPASILCALNLRIIEKEEQMADTKKPGEVADRSGEWEIRGPRGGHTGQERTVARGERLPPTPERGQSYTLHRAAHNKSGRGR